MLFKTATQPTREVKIAPVIASAPSATEIVHCDGELSKAELRRQMYERIAEGNGLAEAEEHARQMWKGQ
ncbi:MAG: hypothetical protein K8L97_00810 [Anaerolineae bacterium]|nr:hypothetical protein [Anaerolineae bacterium]